MIKNTEVYEQFEKLFIKKKVKYVYGMKYKIMTESMFKSLKKIYSNMIPSSNKSKIGKLCCDCSGCISKITGKSRGSAQWFETATKRLPISQIDKAVIGCALYKKGHIEWYFGNGKCGGMRNSSVNCIVSNYKKMGFTHILWLDAVDYSKVEYFKKYTGKSMSIVDALNSIGINSSKDNRKKIAKANGIKSYAFKPVENIKILNLLKKGKLIKP